jgi:hypothetical protein
MINPSSVPEQSPHIHTTTDDTFITPTRCSTSRLISGTNQMFRVVSANTRVLRHGEVLVWRAALDGCFRERVTVVAALGVRVIGECFEGIGGEEPSLSCDGVGDASFVGVWREDSGDLFTVLVCGFVRTITVCCCSDALL